MRALWLVPALALTLTACSGAPSDELRGDVEAVTLAANDGSAQGVRDAVQELLSTLRAQVASGELDRTKAERLRELALRIEKSAVLLEDVEPSPAPAAPSPEPEPTREPEPTPEPEPTEEEPEPTAEPEPEPEPEPTLDVVVPPVEQSPTPAAQLQGGSGASPQGSPAA